MSFAVVVRPLYKLFLETKERGGKFEKQKGKSFIHIEPIENLYELHLLLTDTECSEELRQKIGEDEFLQRIKKEEELDKKLAIAGNGEKDIGSLLEEYREIYIIFDESLCKEYRWYRKWEESRIKEKAPESRNSERENL